MELKKYVEIVLAENFFPATIQGVEVVIASR